MIRKYEFHWGLLGDLEAGRPNLGKHTRVEVYRLMQFCMRDVLERQLGSEGADKVFYDAGCLAGTTFYDHMLKGETTLKGFVSRLQQIMKELEIGVLRLEESAPDCSHFVMTVSEDLDCSGLPELDFEICTYDEGFIAGLLGRFTGKAYRVKEIDCWCTGDRTCRFRAEIVS